MKRILTLANLRLAIEIILVIGALAFTLSRSTLTEAASTPVPEAPDATYWYQCNAPTTMHVGLFGNRIHVYCPTTTPVSTAPALSASIHWFAVPTAPDSAAASRYLSLFQSAAISGRYLWVQLNPTDTSGSTFGCGSGDCRRIYGAELR
jgi:hypothetical protein